MATTTSLNIAFIGGGNMASALIAGLLAKGQPSSLLHVVETDAEKLADFEAQGLNTYNASNIDDTKHAIEKADVVVLAVKPQVIKDVLLPVKDSWGEQVVISITAGIGTDSLAEWLGPQVKLVRAMPNTPCDDSNGCHRLVRDSSGQRGAAATCAASDVRGRTGVMGR